MKTEVLEILKAIRYATPAWKRDSFEIDVTKVFGPCKHTDILGVVTETPHFRSLTYLLEIVIKGLENEDLKVVSTREVEIKHKIDLVTTENACAGDCGLNEFSCFFKLSDTIVCGREEYDKPSCCPGPGKYQCVLKRIGSV